MAESLIRWNKQDEMKLQKAVNDFNKKIRRLEKEENNLQLPDTLNYQDLRENISTRSELNRRLSSLERFQKEGAESLYTTKAGEKLTKWEYQETIKQRNIARNRLNKELEDLGTPKYRSKIFKASNGIYKSSRN